MNTVTRISSVTLDICLSTIQNKMDLIRRSTFSSKFNFYLLKYQWIITPILVFGLVFLLFTTIYPLPGDLKHDDNVNLNDLKQSEKSPNTPQNFDTPHTSPIPQTVKKTLPDPPPDFDLNSSLNLEGF